jgi:transcription initiation factor TFIIIB Brf1 subunit/transcription initiation factor TFIIB
MYRAGDAVEHADSLAELEAAADDLDLGDESRRNARDLFLSAVPDEKRSRRAALAAAIYAGALIAGDQRSQGAVADAVGVARLSVGNHWKSLLREAGLDPPDW